MSKKGPFSEPTGYSGFDVLSSSMELVECFDLHSGIYQLCFDIYDRCGRLLDAALYIQGERKKQMMYFQVYAQEENYQGWMFIEVDDISFRTEDVVKEEFLEDLDGLVRTSDMRKFKLSQSIDDYQVYMIYPAIGPAFCIAMPWVLEDDEAVLDVFEHISYWERV